MPELAHREPLRHCADGIEHGLLIEDAAHARGALMVLLLESTEAHR